VVHSIASIDRCAVVTATEGRLLDSEEGEDGPEPAR
jgi:hypothetical protein